MKKNIFILSHCKNEKNLMTALMNNEEYMVFHYHSLNEIINTSQKNNIVIVDCCYQYHLLNEVKSSIDTAVIALIDTFNKREIVFSLGAWDYIMFPIISSELITRIKSYFSLFSVQSNQKKNRLITLKDNNNPDIQGIEKEHNNKAELIQKVCQYLLENISLNYTLTELAHKMATNRNKLTQASKNVLGMGIHRWLVSERMKKAEKLCLTTGLSIQEIGFQVGYNNPNSFSMAFKAFFKQSPRQYRKKNRT
ncbi:hypothetical protein AB835_05520 [Candidatus Endobugula sertula]|uniref:HTH araC/xylS-type domain-containing protein n=1 Tax=Candidatus Endobugula sertula TaxID=62101 RepID=A0A1D2QR74_9GAMM|nr:hypothetical protein AB835_05520 [Candidatus Endobugula sertula]